MKASELKQGETYGTVWGYEMEFVGTEELSAYYEETDETRTVTRYVFKADGTVNMSEDDVEKFVSKATVEISVKRLDEIMAGVTEREDKIDEALRKVNRLTAAIEDMKLDCDSEVYEELLKIADILGR